MARVLLVGIDPEEVDFSDPALPPSMNAETIKRGIARGLEELRAAGHDAQHFYVPDDLGALNVLAERLARDPVDCVTIGGGVRLPPRNLPLFEAILNTIARLETSPVIALPARPEDLVAAVTRVSG